MSWDNSADTAGSSWNNDDAAGGAAWKNDDAGSGDTWNDAGGNTGSNDLEKNTTDNHAGPPSGRGCFNCGEEGHSKADCTNPRVPRPFTGTCRICQKEGHSAKECPDKPPVLCRNCKKEGHTAIECKENRVLDLSDVADELPEVAWDALKAADQAMDLDELRKCLKVYCKAVPETTYDQLERAFRLHNFNIFLIAREKDLFVNQTFVNLQGRIGRKYEVGLFWDPKPKRAVLGKGWPATGTENLTRLTDAGVPMDRGIPKCGRCGELGHVARECPQEKVEVERVEVKCVICDSTDHRARDCTNPRVDPFACRNCKKSGHQATECTEPRSAEGVECKKCGGVGHFARDCPTGGKQECRNCGEEGHKANECEKPKDPARALCKNCDTIGHFTRDCTVKKDWSKVKCNRCGEMGHTVKRCPHPDPEAEDPHDDADMGGVELNVPAAPQGDWETGAPVAQAGNWAPQASSDTW